MSIGGVNALATVGNCSEGSDVEFYKQNFGALVAMYGREFALDKVRYYQGLSARFASSSTWNLHTCELLRSYNRMLAGSMVDSPQWPQFSYFRAPIKNITPFKSVTLAQLHQVITGRYYVGHTARCRELYKEYKQTGDKAPYRAFKAKYLDYVCLSGTFSQRADDHLIKFSGYLCLDFDEVRDLNTLKASLLQDLYFETQMFFVSPSGAGLKWIIELDQQPNDMFFSGLKGYIKKKYNHTIDNTPDLSRACFVGFDPECFLNPKYL
jgi:hypothetical protein